VLARERNLSESFFPVVVVVVVSSFERVGKNASSSGYFRIACDSEIEKNKIRVERARVRFGSAIEREGRGVANAGGGAERGQERVGEVRADAFVEGFDVCAVSRYIRETYFMEVGRVVFSSVSRGEHRESRRD
jgi:hypothetical protein